MTANQIAMMKRNSHDDIWMSKDAITECDTVCELCAVSVLPLVRTHMSGSFNRSPGTSIQVISCAAGSPGEHGVR